MRSTSRLTALYGLLAGIACSGAAAAQAAPAEGDPAPAAQASVPAGTDLAAAPLGWKIESVRTAGPGCPNSGPPAVVWISPEGDALDVELGFQVAVSETDARPEDSASCTLIIGMRVPAGYAYAPTHLRVSGRSLLPEGVQASLVTSYGFQGSGLSASNMTQRIAAPSEFAAFDFADDFAASPMGLQWSRCGEQQLLNVNLVLHLRNAEVKKRAWAALSYATGLRLAWKRCP